MTSNLKNFQPQILEAFKAKDFDNLFSLFSDKSFSFVELLVFYKQKNSSKLRPYEKLFSFKEFWVSQLPHFHLNNILESDLKVSFLQSYLAEDENCSHELNTHLIAIAKHEFIQFIKLQKAFNLPTFYASLKRLSKADAELERVIKEFDIVINAQKRNVDEAMEDEKLFLQYSFDEIALAFTLYFHNFKRTYQVKGNKSLQTQIEMALTQELTSIISLFQEKSNFNQQFRDNDDLQKKFQRNEAPHPILDKERLEVKLEPKFKSLFLLIERLIKRRQKRSQIDLYLCGYSDFQSVVLIAPLRTNNFYKAFKINNQKLRAEELYFMGQSFNSSHPLSIMTDTKAWEDILKFYGVPEKIKHNGGEVELKKVLQLLKHFSVYKGPAERMIFPDGSFFVKNKGEESFVAQFSPNESISIFDAEKLCNGICRFFKWTDEEIKDILSFLTIDLNGKLNSQDWYSSPFLKSGNRIWWLGAFLKDRRWDNILLNKLKKDQRLARNFEKNIEGLFKKHSFKTVCALPFKSSNGQVGDFDVLAYKDKCLIACEAKTTTRSDEFYHAAIFEAVRLEGCAAEQLEKAIFNIKDDWETIKTELGIEEKIELNEVNIVPLIVTDSFEGDLRLYKNAILKTSLLELEVILTNRKRNLLEHYLRLIPNFNISNPDIKEGAGLISGWDLWDGKNECTVDNLLKNIKVNAIWKEIERVWKFEDESYMMDY